MERASKVTGRDAVMNRVRSALGRSPGQAPSAVPPVRFSPERASEELLELFLHKLTTLGVKSHLASPQTAMQVVGELLAGRSGIASNATHLIETNVTALAGVRSGIQGKEELDRKSVV